MCTALITCIYTMEILQFYSLIPYIFYFILKVFNPRPCINLITANPRNLEAALRNLHQRASSNVPNGQLDLVIVILPEIRGSYGNI